MKQFHQRFIGFSPVISPILLVNLKRNFTSETVKYFHRLITGSPVMNSPPYTGGGKEGGPTRMPRFRSLTFPFLSFPNASARSVKSGPTGSDPEVELIVVDCYTFAQGILDLSAAHFPFGCPRSCTAPPCIMDLGLPLIMRSHLLWNVI